ncbi:uncharacterized protein LOC131092833 [Melospiza georgiana]|uniref:uncharacterized protein LOC131092833 n=1 Tax=Melospiza georgiana TaxID=44398 RepID=UPI0025ACA47C|nr:uncharacterized protein LOC131092833 [Melospiza georgiana]XP_057895738.1 uncharacterized protein LOC131092833 [Melospiza georgiana]XP_057895740.1 uncharacterized protein LOC131092833 [Melospiza georgiana]XP_057895741.1 uncharacterized protein LOC131092833 [Melospiza georgiana]XP_057895742.1 uncharacterized protein LOC131092833 [Melospiza georgiana]
MSRLFWLPSLQGCPGCFPVPSLQGCPGCVPDPSPGSFLSHLPKDAQVVFLRFFPVPSPQGCPACSPEVLFLSHPSRDVQVVLLTHLHVLFLSHLPRDAQVFLLRFFPVPSPQGCPGFSPEVLLLSHLPRDAQVFLLRFFPLPSPQGCPGCSGSPPQVPPLCQQTPSPPAQSHSLSPHLSHLLLAASRRSWPTSGTMPRQEERLDCCWEHTDSSPACPKRAVGDYFSFCGGVWAARGTGGCSVAILAEFCQPVPPLLSEPRPQSFGIVPFPSGVSVSGFIFNFLSQIKGCQPPFPTGLARSCSGDRFGSACTTSETFGGLGFPP